MSRDPLDHNVGLHGTSGLLLGITTPGPGWLALALVALLAIGPRGLAPRGAVVLGATLGWLRSGDAAALRASPLSWDRQVEPSSPARRAIQATRAWLGDRLGRCPPRTRRLARALVLGQRLPRDLRETYARAGVVHLVSQSGLHVGLVFGLALRLLRPRLGGGALLVGIATAAAYATLAGGRPAAWRAVGMLVVVATAHRRGLAADPRGVVAFTASAFLLLRPDLVADPGTLLSFAAAFGLSHLSPLVREWVAYQGPGADLLRASLAACLATAPILAWLGVALAPVAPVTNLVAVPLGVMLTTYGLALVGAAALSPLLAQLLAPPFEVGAWALDVLAGAAAAAPGLEGLHLPGVAAGALGLLLHHAGAAAQGRSLPDESPPDASTPGRAEGPLAEAFELRATHARIGGET